MESSPDVPLAAPSTAAPAGCYHCGLPVAHDAHWQVVVDGTPRDMCCPGCAAVAEAIVANGLVEYYRHRDAMPESPRDAVPEVLQELQLYDHPQFQKSFVRELGEHEREAALILEGITCAACVWLNEQHIARQPGVLAVDINYATRRARVRWDARQTHLSAILAAVQAIGYRAHPFDAARAEELSKKERRAALWRLFVAGFGMMQVMMYAVPVYLADGDMTPDIESLMRWASLILTVPVVFYSSAPFFRNAWRDLRLRRVGMDVPVALGVGAAFLASVWATLSASGEVYFDSVTMFVFFLLCGRYLEMIARQQAVRSAERLTLLAPAFAARLTAWPALETERVPVSQLAVGDFVLVKPGETVPADSTIVQGVSSTDEALLTGESRPVTRRAGDAVPGGAVNAESPLVLRVERVGEATLLAQIIRLMERAAAERPRLVEMADRIAARFVAALLVVAALVAAVWLSIDPQKALWISVSVLVVTCPCALSLATPVALTAATGALTRIGLLVTRGHAVETLARATHFVFDKTGTLTTGRLRLTATLPLGDRSAQACLRLAAALEQGSEHPIGAAIRDAAGAPGSPAALGGVAGDVVERRMDAGSPGSGGVRLDGLRAVPGAGMEALVDGRTMRLGKPDYVAELHGLPLPPQALSAAGVDTRVALGDASGWLALFVLGDALRSDARELVDSLHAAGHRTLLLSGDAPEAVGRVAQALGIADWQGGMTPQDKHDRVAALQAGGAVVAMVGDGVNDAPVLARAQVSVAMGGGTDLARKQADVILLSEHLRPLQEGVKLARRALVVIRQNLVWSFAYNFLALPAAMLGYVTPWMAGIGMSASSLLVVLNSLRLQRSLPQQAATPGVARTVSAEI